MDIQAIRDSLPDYARDLRLNLGSVLAPTGAPGLDEAQIWGIALASSIAARSPVLTAAVERHAREHGGDATVEAAKAAAAVMGMNNVYYRFLHLVGDQEYARLPAKLRMNVIAKPGIDKAGFELMSIAVSAINGCGMCIESHEKTLRAEGIGREAIQSAVRIAAVINAAAGTLAYEQAA
jgi:alkyl hydroperoxide reductase subunit D